MLIVILALALLLTWADREVATAQEATPTPEPSEETPAATPEPVIPDTIPEIDQQIALLESQIAELNAEADKLVSMSEQDRKKKIRAQVKSLKLQRRILERRRKQLEEGLSQAEAQVIRERYRERIRQIEARNAQRRRETIARYEAILARNPNSRIAPDVLWRLSYLYFEEAHANYLDAWDRYEGVMERLYSAGDTDAVMEEPRHDYSRTIELLNQLLRDHPVYEKKDNVLYLLAYCLQEQGDDDTALGVYQRIIDETPESSFVPEAYVRMGEIYFDRDQHEMAIERYQHVLSYERSKFYDKALYKMGWSYYKMNDYERAVKYFHQVLDFYAEAHRRGAGSEDMRQDAVDYIAISFTEAEGTDGARAAERFMQTLENREMGRQLLIKVGEVYDERTDYEAAREAYRAYLRNYPLVSDVPEVYHRIAVTYEKQALYEEAVAIYIEIGQNLGPDSQWAQANQDQVADVEAAAKLRQNSILSAATFYHEKAQQAGGAESHAFYLKAIEVYVMYVQNYPDTEGYYEAAYNLAECYMETKQYQLAAEMYYQVVQLKKDEEMWTEALFNHAKAYELQLELEGGLPNQGALEERTQVEQEGVDTTGQRKTLMIKPAPMSETTSKWIEALKLHVQGLPNSERSPIMLYKVGEVYYLHGDFENARLYFEQLFEQYPSNVVVQYAAHFYLETYKQREDWDQLRTAINRIPSTEHIDVSQLEQRRTGVTLKIAEQLMREATSATPVDKNKLQQAINEYLGAVQRNPSDPNAHLALYNVAVAYENHLLDLTRANENYVVLAQRYPQSKHAPDALWKAAFNYQVLVEFNKAIESYQTFARLYPDHENGGNALLNAADLLRESGRLGSALPLYQQFLQRYATEGAQASEIAFMVAQLYEKTGNPSAAAVAYEDYAKRGTDDAARMIEAYFRWGRIMESRGNWPEAEKRYHQTKAIFQKVHAEAPDLDTRYAAEAQFRVVERRYQEYKRLVYTGNSRRDAKVFKQKGEMAAQLKVLFEEVITFGNYYWATAALHMIGAVLDEYADSTLNAPPPSDLPPELQDEYMFKLEEAVYPFKNAAQEWYKRNLQKGIEERLINEWVVRSYLEVLKVEPGTVEPKFETPTSSESQAIARAALDEDLPEPPAPTPSPTVTPPAGEPTGGEQPPPAGGSSQLSWLGGEVAR